MKINYKLILQNKYILYLLFIIILLQIIIDLNIGNYNNVFLLIITSIILSIFNKNLIIVFIFTLIIIYLVKIIKNIIINNTSFNYSVIEGITDATTPTTLALSADDIKDSINEQEQTINDLKTEINNIYNGNLETIHKLKLTLQEAQSQSAAYNATSATT